MRQKLQFIAIIVTIVLGVTLFGASYDAFRNLKASYNKTYETLSFADLTVSGGDIDKLMIEAQKVDGVEHVTKRDTIDIPFRINGTHKLVGRVVGMPSSRQPAVDKVKILEGSYLKKEETDGVLVEQHMADHFDLKPGSTLEILGSKGWLKASTLGVVASPEYLWPARSRQDIITTPDEFGVVFAQEGDVSLAGKIAVQQLLILYEDGADTEALNKSLSATAESLGASDVQTQEQQPSNAALNEDVSGFGQMSIFFPTLFLTAAGMATVVLMTRIVYSQRAQIGTLLANGIDRRAVLRHYLGFGLIVGVIGAVIGIVFGAMLGILISGVYTKAISVPDTVIKFRVITPVVGLLFGIVAGIVAAATPALAAFRIAPAEAMRGEIPTGHGRISLFERILPPLRRVPTRWKMVLRGIGRNKRRTLSTVIGVVLSLMLILVSAGMLDTVNVILDKQFNEIQRQDSQAYLEAPLTDKKLDQFADVKGVERAEPVVQLTASASSQNGSKHYQTEMIGFEKNTEMHEFITKKGRKLELPASGVLAGIELKSLLGISEGDQIRVALPATHKSIDVKVAGFVDEPLGTFIYISRSNLTSLLTSGSKKVSTKDLESPGVASVMMRYDSGVDNSKLNDQLNDLPDVAAFTNSRALFHTAKSFMGLFYAFVGIMLLFGGAMAFALMFNTMSVNIAARSVELATMRASGLGRDQIARLLTGENMMTTAMGILPGLVAGYWISALFMRSFSSDLFQFNLQMKTSTLIISAVAILVVALISQWPGLRAMKRFEIAKVVRERSQ